MGKSVVGNDAGYASPKYIAATDLIRKRAAHAVLANARRVLTGVRAILVASSRTFSRTPVIDGLSHF
jgi:hypothetical protein